jgi:uncharacterized protein (DUF427 family)
LDAGAMVLAGDMMAKPKLMPSDAHPITVEPATERVVVTAGGKTVADSRSALVLRESSYPAAYYLPREDADLSLLERTEHASYCPYKGDATYYSVLPAGETGVNAVWTYESPYAAVAALKDHLAFYPNRVDSIETLPL